MNSPTVHTLKQRISQMQPVKLPERSLPTHPALRPLLPGASIRAGASYAVHGSWQLALAFLTEASQAGSWCSIIGCPAFGAEAAARLGIALDRCVLLPHPGDDAFALAGALSEVTQVTLLAVPDRAPAGAAERLSARLREHGSALVVSNSEWPRPAASLSVTGSHWEGLDAGFGALRTHTIDITARSNQGLANHTLRFQDGTLATGRTP